MATDFTWIMKGRRRENEKGDNSNKLVFNENLLCVKHNAKVYLSYFSCDFQSQMPLVYLFLKRRT